MADTILDEINQTKAELKIAMQGMKFANQDFQVLAAQELATKQEKLDTLFRIAKREGVTAW